MDTIYVKKLRDDAIIPTRGTEDSAGLDLYATETVLIRPGYSENIHTGICMEIPKGHVGLIYARSSLACKKGLRPANCVGVIDADYRGELIVCLRNDDMNLCHKVKKGERCAQIVITEYWTGSCELKEDLSDTSRGVGGFGSTGV